MISEVDYHARLLDATVFIRTINKVLRFTSRRQVHLRELVKYVQERVMELRMQQPVSREQQSFAPQFSTIVPLDPPAYRVEPLAPQPQVQLPRVHMKAFRRLGAYPTASFTIHRQNTPSIPSYHNQV